MIRRGVIDRELIARVRKRVLEDFQTSESMDIRVQGGFKLPDAEPYLELREVLLPIARSICYGVWCDLSSCSARIQSAQDIDRRLNWHQDAAPMKSDGVVAWVPLDPIDGSRPSLEICDRLQEIVSHETDSRGFLIATKAPLKGEVLTAMDPGDVAFFSPYAMHRTHIDPTMPNTRLSVDMRFKT